MTVLRQRAARGASRTNGATRASQPRGPLAGDARLVGLAQRHEREEGQQQRSRKAAKGEPRLVPPLEREARSPDDAPWEWCTTASGTYRQRWPASSGAQVEVDVLPRKPEALVEQPDVGEQRAAVQRGAGAGAEHDARLVEARAVGLVQARGCSRLARARRTRRRRR